MIGTVTAVDGSTLTVTSTAGTTYTVTVSSSTTITVDKTITLADLTAGEQVMVAGTTSNGVVTATTIRAGSSGFGPGGFDGPRQSTGLMTPPTVAANGTPRSDPRDDRPFLLGSEASMSNASSQPRVLVVDDEEHITELVAMGLGYNGFEVDARRHRSRGRWPRWSRPGPT